jgi:hypothetical protein
VEDLTAESAISAGGWDARYAITLAVAVNDRVAAALVDTNGDGADIDLDEYERDAGGHWREAGSGSAGECGSSWSPRMVATWGRANPGEHVDIRYLTQRWAVSATASGWWLCVMPTEDEEAAPERVYPSL